MLRSLRALLLLLGLSLGLLGPSPVTAAGQGHPRKIAGKLALWLASPELRARRLGEPRPLGSVPVIIAFAGPLTPAQRRHLEQSGVSFLTSEDQPRHVGRIYPAKATLAGVRALEGAAFVEHVELDLLLRDDRPLDLTIAEIQGTDAWPTTTDGQPVTGRGVVIGSMDSGVDPFHPDFFHADGGLYAWIDGNRNGAFDPGIDAVDLDADGVADPDEGLNFFDALAFAWDQPILGSDNQHFDPDTDWLYVDANQSGRRDFGADFGDTVPTFGERMFVAEDLDRDGQLDPEEKLRALGSSKIRAVSVDGVVHTRGVDVTTIDTAQAFHGTGTTGIMIGGQLGHHRRIGAAPDAEVVMGQMTTTTGLGELMTWLEEQGAELILHEYAPWTGYHLDGSSLHEQMMDQLSARGIPQVNPAGNLGGSGKQASLTIGGGETATTSIQMVRANGEYSFLQLTLLWRAPGVDLEVRLIDPSGRSQVLSDRNLNGLPWGDGASTWYSYREDSSRGTAMDDFYLLGPPIPQGEYQLVVHNPSPNPIALRAYLADDLTSWSRGIYFGEHESEDGIVCFPATADSAIAVAAYTGHAGPPYEVQSLGNEPAGALRYYSGRGTRIDGIPVIDLAAPDNPLAASPNQFVGLGGYFVFGGTSGAGPHVAGATALLAQVMPGLSGEVVRTRLRDSALADVQTGPVPSIEWGAGKVRAYRALYDRDPVPGSAPVVHLYGPATVPAGGALSLHLEASDAEDPFSSLTVRWDDGYQDQAGAPGPITDRELVAPNTPGPYWIKAIVRDPSGREGQAALRVDVGAAPPPPPLDAGVPVDATVADLGWVDAGADAGVDDRGQPSPDSGLEPELVNTEEGGCGCQDAGRDLYRGSAAAAWLAFFALVLRRPRRSAKAKLSGLHHQRGR